MREVDRLTANQKQNGCLAVGTSISPLARTGTTGTLALALAPVPPLRLLSCPDACACRWRLCSCC